MTDADRGNEGGSRRDVADEFQGRMQAFGREAQVAGERLARDPGVIAFGAWVSRLWGVVLIAVGLWLLGEFTLGLDMPAIDWATAGPAALIVLGGLLVLTASLRRR